MEMDILRDLLDLVNRHLTDLKKKSNTDKLRQMEKELASYSETIKSMKTQLTGDTPDEYIYLDDLTDEAKERLADHYEVTSDVLEDNFGARPVAKLTE